MTAHAAVPEGQPESVAYPQHRAYGYGSERQPYRVSFHARNWFITTDDYYLYEPVAGAETPATAPVVVFFQGFVIDGPWQVDRLIRHLARSGITVVYPTYLNMVTNVWSFADWVERSTGSIQDALAVLGRPGHVTVERDSAGQPKLAFVAHSIGSYVASFVAERAADTGEIPRPRVLAFMDPAGFDYKPYLGIDTERLGDLDAATDVIMLSAEDELFDEQGLVTTNSQHAVQDLVDHLPVDCERLSAWVIPSDVEDETALVSDHYGGPQTHQVFDAVDWWGYWPQLSAHLKYAFWGTYGSFTHAGGLYAGSWRDKNGDFDRPIEPRLPHPMYPAGYACP